jgi:hypothetical protein
VTTPLLFAPLGRAIPALDRLIASGGVDVVRVANCPAPANLDAERPTIVLLDRAMAAGADLEAIAAHAAVIALGDAGESEPDTWIPLALLSGWISASPHCGTRQR